MPKTLYNEKELLTGIKVGDRTAFAELYNFYQPQVFSIAFRFTRSYEESEDVVQEVFAKVWQSSQNLADLEFFRAYLYTLTRNLIYNLLKRQAKEELILLEVMADKNEKAINPARTFSASEWKDLANRLLNDLPQQQRRVFQLGKLEGLKHEEIAQILNISTETVKKHMIAAVKSVRTKLEAENGLLIFLLIDLGCS